MFYRKKIVLYVIALLIGCERKMTFHNDIKPIIHRNCATCHNSEGAGPFNLITYQDVSKRTKMIEAVIQSKYMPPWPADPNYRSFINQKNLSKDEIKKISKWIKDGKEKGKSSTNNTLDSIIFENQKKKPDLIVHMANEYITSGLNKDEFLMMKFPFELATDTFIEKIEFIPGNTKIVHHINAHLITYKNKDKQNIFKGVYYADTEKFSDQECFEKLDILNDDGTYPLLTTSVSNYLPGSEQISYPKGIGGYKGKKKNIILVNDFHYAPTQYPENDKSKFNIYFSATAPERQIQETQLGTFGISEIIPPLIIPPNEIKKFKTKATITNDISLLTINPHMHLLGKSFLAYAVTLKNDTIPLIKINEWNFRWQYFYTFKKMLKLPAGSEIIVEATYDNTIDNPDNPFNPPQLVTERKNINGKGSMRTSDEMLQFIINYLPYQAGDENISLEL